MRGIKNKKEIDEKLLSRSLTVTVVVGFSPAEKHFLLLKCVMQKNVNNTSAVRRNKWAQKSLNKSMKTRETSFSDSLTQSLNETEAKN